MKKFYIICYTLLIFLVCQTTFAEPNISISFVLDESRSITSNNFELETEGFINALNGLPTDGSVELSIIGFSSRIEILKSSTVLTPSTIDSFKSALQGNTQERDSTRMSAAIQTSTDLLSSSSAPTKIICLATDGEPDSKSSTQSESTSAKNLGITLTPIGIELNSNGKTFLDSIASTPPIPNPSNFTEFATVVRNDCVGVVESALNIQLEPDSVDFGIFNPLSIDEDLKICVDKPQFIGVLNKSNQPAEITNIEIIGQDAGDYEIESFMGVSADQLTYPIRMSPLFQTQVSVRLKPNRSSQDASYDAALKVTAKDQNGVEDSFTAALLARLSSSIPSCLGVTPIDASPVIHSIDSGDGGGSPTGTPLHVEFTSSAISVAPVTENDIATVIEKDSNNSLGRTGMVADGNARILLVAKTRQPSGIIRFEITNPTLTEARLYGLDLAPTYVPQSSEQGRVYDSTGKTKIDLEIETNSDGFGQVTAILRAGERFLGTGETADFQINTCILEEDEDDCSQIEKDVLLKDYRTPVVLVHGIWANPGSFGKVPDYSDEDSSIGLYDELIAKGHKVRYTDYCGTDDGNNCTKDDYPGHLGPSELATSSSIWIHREINTLCETFRTDGIACTRADIIGHSMGGLMSRSYVLRHKNYYNSNNYGQGSVRRLITLGTPHLGSGLANFLKQDDDGVDGCIREDEKLLYNKIVTIPGIGSMPDRDVEIIRIEKTGYEVINLIVEALKVAKKPVASAIDDLQTGDDAFLAREDIRKPLPVPVYAIYGDIDDGIIIDLNKFGNLAPDSCGNDTPNECASRLLDHTTGCSVGEIFLSEDSDGIVPLKSGKWDGYLPNTLDNKYHTKLDGIKHTGMGTNKTIIPLAESLLNGPISEFYQ